jgi:hypothetical protein
MGSDRQGVSAKGRSINENVFVNGIRGKEERRVKTED